MRIVTALLAMAAQAASAVEPAAMSTLEDGNHGVLIAAPDLNLPQPGQVLASLPPGAAPHGLAFLGGNDVLFADFATPRVFRTSLATPGVVVDVALAGRTTGNGTLAADPNGRYAISIGETLGMNAVGEAVVLDFATTPPAATTIPGGMRVRSFVTAAIDFAPDGRAFVCHTTGVSVLKPPYTSIEFTIAFPPVVASPSMCRLARDGSRLFVTRVLSETAASVNGVRVLVAPFNAQSTFVTMPAPNTVQGLGPMAVSPDGQALLVGQQFLFPGDVGTRARAWLLRAPFGTGTVYEEVTLPTSLTGINCTAEGNPRDCPGFEHIEASHDGTLAVLTGNSSSVVANVADRVPAVFIRNPFANDRDAVSVQVAPAAVIPGRGTGAVRFQPARVFRDGLETL